MIFMRGKTNGESPLQRLVDRLFYTPIGAMIVSGLFGMALAFMFQRVCKDKRCVIVQSPPLKDINEFVYRVKDGECYKYTSRVVKCA